MHRVRVFVLLGQDHGDDAAEAGEGDALRVLAQGALHALALLEALPPGLVERTLVPAQNSSLGLRAQAQAVVHSGSCAPLMHDASYLKCFFHQCSSLFSRCARQTNSSTPFILVSFILESATAKRCSIEILYGQQRTSQF